MRVTKGQNKTTWVRLQNGGYTSIPARFHGVQCSHGPLPVSSTYNSIYGMYCPIHNILKLVITVYHWSTAKTVGFYCSPLFLPMVRRGFFPKISAECSRLVGRPCRRFDQSAGLSRVSPEIPMRLGQTRIDMLGGELPTFIVFVG